MANRLKIFRERAGFTQEELARRLNSGRSTVVKLERGERPLTSKWLQRLSVQLDCTQADLVGEDVPVVGRIGAGGSIIFEDVGAGETVKRPPDVYGELVGLEIDGESMLPKFDPGDVVFISRDHDGYLDDYFGAICAIRLVTGETYLKIFVRGSRPGRATLRSINTAFNDIEDVEVEWATPVRAILPRYARRFS